MCVGEKVNRTHVQVMRKLGCFLFSVKEEFSNHKSFLKVGRVISLWLMVFQLRLLPMAVFPPQSSVEYYKPARPGNKISVAKGF